MNEYRYTKYGLGFSVHPPAKFTGRVTIYRASRFGKSMGAVLIRLGMLVQRLGESLESAGLSVQRGQAVGTEEYNLGERIQATQERMAANMLNLFDKS